MGLTPTVGHCGGKLRPSAYHCSPPYLLLLRIIPVGVARAVTAKEEIRLNGSDIAMVGGGERESVCSKEVFLGIIYRNLYLL